MSPKVNIADGNLQMNLRKINNEECGKGFEKLLNEAQKKTYFSHEKYISNETQETRNRCLNL